MTEDIHLRSLGGYGCSGFRHELTMRTPAPLPDPLDRRSFTVREALSLGIPHSRLRSRDLTTPSRGVRVPQDACDDVITRARPLIQLNATSCISHVTAAKLHGIAVPRGADELLHLSRSAGRPLTRRDGVISHRLAFRQGDITEMDGVPVTSVFRTFLDLGTVLHLDDLIAAGDSIVSEHHRHFGAPRIPLIQIRDLRSRIESTSKVHGIRAARAAIDLMEPGVDSPPETAVRLMLGRAGLPVFTPNCPVGAEHGMPVWADLGCPEYRTCIEYDGGHHLTPEQQQFDARRDQRTREAGWAQVKLNKLDLRRGEQWVVSLVRKALRAQGWRG